MYNEWEKNQKNINSENDVDMTEGSYVDSTHYERTQENRQADRNREAGQEREGQAGSRSQSGTRQMYGSRETRKRPPIWTAGGMNRRGAEERKGN